MLTQAELSRIAPEPVPASVVMLKKIAFGTYSAVCNECGEMFDISGELRPGNNGTAADTVVAKCITHTEICARKNRPYDKYALFTQNTRQAVRSEVRQNSNSPEYFMVRIEWEL